MMEAIFGKFNQIGGPFCYAHVPTSVGQTEDHKQRTKGDDTHAL